MSSLPPPCEICGYLAAAASALGFGSFGVPIKGARIELDPLVFQSYKTSVCFVSSWLVLLFDVGFTFSPWGIVSGIFWVPGGVATVYAIQAAGLAVGIGIGSSFIVLVSFTWGIFVFKEPVHSRLMATVAILCMMLGLFGMAHFSSPENSHLAMNTADDIVGEVDNTLDCELEHRRLDTNNITPGQIDSSASLETRRRGYTGLLPQNDDSFRDNDETVQRDGKHNNIHVAEFIYEDEGHDGCVSIRVAQDTAEPDSVMICGRCVSRRQLGMLSAMFTGCWGGSILVPMKYAPPDTKGIHFLISFAIGAAIVNATLWLLRYLFHWRLTKDHSAAFGMLPSFHLKEMWIPGVMCGLLWSFGNFFSLISVFYLGEGVGYPLVQTSILISGLWGMLYFREVKGKERMLKWFGSSLLTVFGILLLSYEHHEK